MRSPNPEPSGEMLEVYRFIIRHVCDHGYQPSQAEMAENFGVTKNAITDRLKGLEKRGFVKLSRGYRERAVVLFHVKFRAIYVDRPE